ncbi:helix-turn-helix transcriptional regulator [uncultured Olegusella sp.]|uniref:helix-turn-helix transcriptional regulator n=1 Tax=uncultured Olegusella sp. TaxID=1979846 RepID=UPI00345D5E76
MKSTLADIRERRGIKKRAVADCINVSYPTYQRYEQNPRLMRVGDLEKVCAFLHCTIGDIFLPRNLN